LGGSAFLKGRHGSIGQAFWHPEALYPLLLVVTQEMGMASFTDKMAIAKYSVLPMPPERRHFQFHDCGE